MKKEINRYTLNLMIGDNFDCIPFALSTLENIDRVTTHFSNVQETTNFLKSYMLLEEEINNLSITYNVNKQVRNVPLIFKDMRSILDDKLLNSRLITYLGRYSNVSNLNIDRMNNKFMKDLLYTMLEQKTAEDFNFRLEKINKHLIEEYKLKRDLVLFLNEEMKKTGKNPIIEQKYVDEENMSEIITCIDKMDIIYTPPIYVPEKENKQLSFLFPETGDAYLDSLIAEGDYDTISRTYDLDTLESLGADYIFDGSHAMTKKRGKV